jgi:hypothetical protein
MSFWWKSNAKLKVELCLCFNWAPRNEGVLGYGGASPWILHLGTRLWNMWLILKSCLQLRVQVPHRFYITQQRHRSLAKLKEALQDMGSHCPAYLPEQALHNTMNSWGLYCHQELIADNNSWWLWTADHHNDSGPGHSIPPIQQFRQRWFNLKWTPLPVHTMQMKLTVTAGQCQFNWVFQLIIQ